MIKDFTESLWSFEWIDILLIDLFLCSIGLTILFGLIWIIGKLEKYNEKRICSKEEKYRKNDATNN